MPNEVSAKLDPVYVNALDTDPVRYTVRDGLPEQEIDRGLASLRSWLDMRLTTDQAIEAVQDLYHLCARRGQDQGDIAGQMAAYAKHLTQHPAPAVLRAMRDWPSRSKWFPTWADLLDRIDAEAAPVRMQVDALTRARSGVTTPRIEQRKAKRHEDLTDEEQAERKAHSARVMEEFRAKQATIPVGEILEPVLSKDQMARIKASKAETKAKFDAKGHEANKRRLGIPEPVENPVDEDEREFGT